MSTFRNVQYEYNLFDLYAAPEIAQHLEALARQGWQLEHIGPVFWRYRKCPPADLHYAVVYFPKDPADEYISELVGHIFWFWAIEMIRRDLRNRITHEPDAEVPLNSPFR